jgi:hypothetical protein
MRVLRQFTMFISGAILAAALAELVLRLLPTPTASMTGYRLDPHILNYPPHHKWQVATGWDLRNAHTLVSNNLGFPVAEDFVADPSVVGLVGDSFIEANMLDQTDRPATQLARALAPRRGVHSLGLPGSSLMDYGQRIRWAHHKLGLRDFVILIESSDLRASYCGSGNTHSPCLDRKTLAYREEPAADPSGFKQLARHSALAQYVVGQLRFDAHRLWRQTFSRLVPVEESQSRVAVSQNTPAPQPRLDFATAVVDRFFADMDALGPGLGRLVFAVSGDTTVAHTASAVERQELEAERQHFLRLAHARGMTVVDLEPSFEKFRSTHKHAIVVAPTDRHLNRLGVAVLVQAVLPLIP